MFHVKHGFFFEDTDFYLILYNEDYDSFTCLFVLFWIKAKTLNFGFDFEVIEILICSLCFT